MQPSRPLRKRHTSRRLRRSRASSRFEIYHALAGSSRSNAEVAKDAKERQYVLAAFAAFAFQGRRQFVGLAGSHRRDRTDMNRLFRATRPNVWHACERAAMDTFSYQTWFAVRYVHIVSVALLSGGA